MPPVGGHGVRPVVLAFGCARPTPLPYRCSEAAGGAGGVDERRAFGETRVGSAAASCAPMGGFGELALAARGSLLRGC